MAPGGADQLGVTGQQTCSECSGEGERRLKVCGLRDGGHFCQWQTMLCTACGGLGFISEHQAEQIERGRRLREDRKARHVTLKQEAARLGISEQALSKLEWGR